MSTILKHIDNSRMSLTVKRIECQKEEILEVRELREDEDFDSFHSSSMPFDKPMKPIENNIQRNNPHVNLNTGMVQETKKNINSNGVSFGITIKRSY